MDIGAVEFLTQLRPNVDSSLHRVIDSILDNLFHLPTVSGDDHGGQHECIYQHNVPAAVCKLFIFCHLDLDLLFPIDVLCPAVGLKSQSWCSGCGYRGMPSVRS